MKIMLAITPTCEIIIFVLWLAIVCAIKEDIMLEKNIKLIPNKKISKYDKGVENMPSFSPKGMKMAGTVETKIAKKVKKVKTR